jgi:hypothetical protein
VDDYLASLGLPAFRPAFETASLATGSRILRASDAIWFISRGVVLDELERGNLVTLATGCAASVRRGRPDAAAARSRWRRTAGSAASAARRSSAGLAGQICGTASDSMHVPRPRDFVAHKLPVGKVDGGSLAWSVRTE